MLHCPMWTVCQRLRLWLRIAALGQDPSPLAMTTAAVPTLRALPPYRLTAIPPCVAEEARTRAFATPAFAWCAFIETEVMGW
jgi:hypothetical protein